MTVSPGRFAIVLELDDGATVAVRQIMQRLGLERPPSAATVPPHVTLVACRNLDVEEFRPMLADVAAHTPVVASTFAGIGVFPTDEGVIFLTPSIGRELVELQLGVLERLQRLEAEVEPYWLRGQWVPHCTLAMGIPRELMPTVVGRACEALHPISSNLTALSLFEIDNPRLRYAFGLRVIR